MKLIRDVASDLEALGRKFPALGKFKAGPAIKGDEIAFSNGVEMEANPNYAQQRAAWEQNLRSNPDAQEGRPPRRILKFSGVDSIDLRIGFSGPQMSPAQSLTAPFHLVTMFSQSGTIYHDGRGHQITIDDRDIRGPASAALRGRIATILEARVKAYFQGMN